MNPVSRLRRTRPATLVCALLLLAGTALIAWVALPESSNEPESPALHAKVKSAPPPAAKREDLKRPSEPIARPAPSRQAIAKAPPRTFVICQQELDGQALPGIRMYRRSEVIAGPSAPNGRLELANPGTGPITLWARGWLPVTVQSDRLPANVEFRMAEASLKLRLLNATPEHRVQKSLLQRQSPEPNRGLPWAPRLEERGQDLWIADQLAPGRYDLYVWVLFPGGESHSYSLRALDLEQSKSTSASIDLATPGDHESDS